MPWLTTPRLQCGAKTGASASPAHSNIYPALKLLQRSVGGSQVVKRIRAGAVAKRNPRIASKFRRASKVGTALATERLHQLDPAPPVKETFVKILHLMLLMLVALAAAGCNTTRGFGQDVEATGEAIEETAEDARDDDR